MTFLLNMIFIIEQLSASFYFWLFLLQLFLKPVAGKRMNKIDELLRLIEEGDAVSILSEENLLESFNELLQHELVNLDEGRLNLTERGILAKTIGIEAFLEQIREDSVMAEFSEDSRKASYRFFLISFFLLFLVVLAFVAVQFFDGSGA